ncbi:TIGR01777 family oxidoreductase [Candidatus Poseidoniaceae archaeon]|nr:TIGR01777 family oxidoreductase [Candidatus Poseidoniaceae archaeon]
MPEWEGIKPVQVGSLKDGEETIFKVSIGPIKRKWIARHHSVVENETFSDRMMKGPFGKWNHQHSFVGSGNNTEIQDTIDWKLPLHILTGWTAAITVIPRMNQMFRYRSEKVANDLTQINKTRDLPRQRVLVSGSTGMIGLQLCAFLEAAGHEVHRLLRIDSKLPADINSENVIRWNDKTGDVIKGDMNGFDSVIHLAGAGIGDKRWSPKRKDIIRNSRVIPTTNLSKILAGLDQPPKAFLSGSAIGYYGDQGTTLVDESSSKGDGFLSNICSEWEQASSVAEEAGIRVSHLRSGIVISPLGGALAKLLLPTKMGGGGPVGGGRQIQSWISLDDEIYAIHHLMMQDTSQGAYNLTSPNSVSQKVFAKKLGRVLRRPAFMPLPKFALQLMFGEMGKVLIIEGQDVKPTRLQESGFVFTYSDLENCLRNCLGRVKN